jgi:hypothetical protein
MIKITILNAKSQSRKVLFFLGILAVSKSFFLSNAIVAQETTIRYTGSTLSNVDYHHGQLSPVVGVHNIQVLRANREHPEMAEGTGWAYNHAPMLAYWNNKFYLEYLSDSIGEHMPPGQTLLTTSADGYHWAKPVVIFPKYRIPDGTVKITEDHDTLTAYNMYAVMHQRIGLYVSKQKRLLALAFYGISMNLKDNPNDGNGIGRVVREVKADGTYGAIYFLRYNHGWNAKNTAYPFYTSSKDKGFVEACNEFLANPLMMMQTVEEGDRNDPLIPCLKQYKAFNFYHLPDGRIVGLWKHALSSISTDGGKTWPSAVRSPGFVNSNAKIWGQRTLDGKYATVYNPSEFRWPLAISTSADGLEYSDLHLVHGEISPLRYKGAEKSFGPQYVRGILEGNGTPPDSNLWVTYSVNKEDIWVSNIPVPVVSSVSGLVNDIFSTMPDGKELAQWNTYSPVWAPVSIEKQPDGQKFLTLRDKDRYDYARAERVIPASKKGVVEFTIRPSQNDKGLLHIDFQDAKGTTAIRFVFDNKGWVWVKNGAKFGGVMQYKAGEEYKFRVSFNTPTRSYSVNVNGKDLKRGNIFFAPVATVERIVFRTAEVRYYPNADTPADQDYDLPQAGEPDAESVYYIKSFKTE